MATTGTILRRAIGFILLWMFVCQMYSLLTWRWEYGNQLSDARGVPSGDHPLSPVLLRDAEEGKARAEAVPSQGVWVLPPMP